MFPVVRTDVHLPPVPVRQLSAAAVQERFAAPREWSPELQGDRVRTDREPVPASVLVPLVRHADDDLRVLLTRRTDHLHDHAGQVSFPGGRADPGDADEVATALRETAEEVGIDAAAIQVIGRLPVYTTGTAYRITPVVSLVDPGAARLLDPFEVDEAFEVPLAFLMNPAHHRWHELEDEGRVRHFLSMPWKGMGSRGEVREYFIWGATAAMLRNLYSFLRA